MGRVDYGNQSRKSFVRFSGIFSVWRDGKTDIAIFRASEGVWHILNSSNRGYQAIRRGANDDALVPADYDGDDKVDVAVFRNGTWYLNRSTAGFTGVSFGTATDKPVPNTFVP